MGFIPRFWSPPFASDLSAPLLRLSRHDVFRLSDLFESVAIFGAIGSGKTTGSGSALSHAALRAGCGMLICCAKPDEADLWRKRARAAGREANLIVVDGSGRHRINFLQYLMQTSPDAGGLVMNTVSALTTVIAASNGRVDAGGDNPFWQKSMREALTHAIAVLWAAYGRINLYDLFALIQSRPMTYEQAADPDWAASSFMGETLRRAWNEPAHPMHEMDYRAALTYLTRTLANPDSRTTGNIIATISADLAPLMQGTMRELFCTGTTVVPEMTHQGAIIVLDFPIRVWGEAGLLAQQMFKYLWQKATEARTVGKSTRPVILWCDEAQFFVSPYDAEFQSTSRSARAGTVYLTQNVPGLTSKIGGPQAQHAVDALLGNFQTKIFHANGCARTNSFASEMIGKELLHRWNGGANESWSDGRNVSFGGGASTSPNGGGTSYSDNHSYGRSSSRSGGSSVGYSEQMDYRIQPAVFTRLRKGGKANRGLVDGLIFQAGRTFNHTGRSFLPVVFRQR